MMPWPTLWLSRCAAFRHHDLIARPSYLGTPKLSKEPSGFSVGEKGLWTPPSLGLWRPLCAALKLGRRLLFFKMGGCLAAKNEHP